MGRADPKSRLGCAQCKRRKCNETLPACGNCVRRREKCSYLDPGAFSSQPSRSPPSDSSSPASQPAGARSPRSLLEIELTYFFLTETLPSILFSPRQDIWRRVIFPHGFSHPEVLDCQLATAALHRYAIARPTEQASEYLQFAAEKQASVLATFVPMLSNPSADNARSLFAVSAMVTFWAFASGSLPPRVNITSMLPFGVTTGDPSTRIAELISIIKVSRGIRAVIHRCRTWLDGQGLAEMIKGPDISMRPCPDACSALDRLLEDLQDEPSITQSQLRVYMTGMERTKYFLQRMAGDPSKEIGLGWPIGLPQPFVDALSRYEPAALIVLAFWVAAFHDAQHIQWWAVGWGRDVVTEIDARLADRWRCHLEWPLMAVQTQEQKDPDIAVDPMLF